MNTKRIVKVVLPICLLLVLGITTVKANTSTENWAGKINFNYIGLDWQTKSSSSSKSMTIKWTGAEASNFDLYFRVLNKDLGRVSSCQVKYLGTTTYNIPTVNGREYLLQGSRENMWDPTVYCAGNWKIN